MKRIEYRHKSRPVSKRLIDTVMREWLSLPATSTLIPVIELTYHDKDLGKMTKRRERAQTGFSETQEAANKHLRAMRDDITDLLLTSGTLVVRRRKMRPRRPEW